MHHKAFRRSVFSYFSFGLGFGAMCIAAGAIFGGGDTRSDGEAKQIHKISYPDAPVGSTAAGTPCYGEAAAYAIALGHLENAKRVADETYIEWYQCVYGTTPIPVDDPEPEIEDRGVEVKTYSVLEK